MRESVDVRCTYHLENPETGAITYDPVFCPEDGRPVETQLVAKWSQMFRAKQ